MTQLWCAGLQDVRRGDVEIVGAKAASLGELICAGFDVPPGFVVTTAAYRLAVRGVSPGSGVEGLPVPEAVQEAIRQACLELVEGPVAVRSSATAEDLPGAAFAGQQDTYLNVEGAEAVLTAVRDCWASLFSERAVAYRARLRIDPASVAMGVVVQKMVVADAAGVMFTADPVTGDRGRVVVNASRGLGESVVSGRVTPDHLVIGAGGRIIQVSAGRSRRVGSGGRGITHSHGPIAVSDELVVRLAELGRQIADHFERPQDIEWALRDAKLFILQSRAMTALPPAPVALNRVQRAIGSMVLELLPRRPLPMELTAATRPIVAQNVMGMTFELTGVSLDFETILPQEDFIVQQLLPPRLRPTLRSPTRLFRTLVRGLRGSPALWRTDPHLAAYRHGCAELDQLDPRQLTWGELVDVPHRAQLLARTVTQLRVDHMPAALAALAKLGFALLVSPSGATARDVLAASPTMTRAANEELAALAGDARQIRELRELLTTGDVAQVEALARSMPAVAPWWHRFQDFLATYGHRETTSILLVHDPCWAEAPDTVFALIRVLLDKEEGRSPSPTSGAGLATWQRPLAKAAAEGVGLREDTHFELTRVLPAVRRAVEEMGRRFVVAGELDDAEDVWMLTLAEVSAWTRGAHAGGQDLRSIADRRSRAYAELAATPLIATTTLYPRPSGLDSALVVGTAGGSGRATGRVRIIGGPHEFNNLRAKEVLVCSATNPSWTPLFLRAAAVVVDHGGIASHAAIVAREYGIPAVMGAANATSTLHDGQLVTVDGDAGQIIAEAERP
ncbi:MAG: PEP/pyruvate-binding domain-containing protein [Dermatophilaceae bacterium]